jgi:hypothetical protein
VDFVLACRDIEDQGIQGKQQRFDALLPAMRERFKKAKDPAASAFSQYRTSIKAVTAVLEPPLASAETSLDFDSNASE